MDIPSKDLNGDCGCIHSDGFQNNKVEENISTFHNNGNSVQNGDFLQSPEELDPKTMEFEKLLQLMHPEFVSDYLTRLLNFLKSDEYIISFPNIAPFKAAFLKKLVRKLEYKGFNDTCKGIALEIIDILDENKAVYKWIFTYDHGRFAKDVPAYRKIFYKKRSPNVHKFKIPCTKAPKSSVSVSPKSNTSSVEELKMAKTDIYSVTQKKNCTEDILNTTQSTDTSECSDYKSKRTLKKHRMYTKRQKLILELLPEYVETSLNSILSLVEDEMRASLIFNDVNENEARFYKSIIPIVKSRKSSGLFPKSCKCILVQLKRLLKKSSKLWEIRVEEDIVDRDNKLRDVTLTKVPIGESLSPDNRSVSEPNDSVVSRGSDGNRSIESNLSRDRSISNDKRSQRSWNGIQFECGGRIELAENANSDACKTQANGLHSPEARAVPEATGVPGREHGTHSKEVELTASKSRLIEALSVPLECNKAVRMMRLMGWQGGALGARGDGITEPIMPTLNIVTGAGLGHSVQATTKQQNSRKKKQSDRIPVEFRIELLDNILALLRSDASERDVAYAPPLCKKEKIFLNNALNAFNRRNRLGLNDRIEQQLVKSIYEGMLRDPELVLKTTISEDSMLLTLSKSTNIYVLPSRKNKKKVTSIENNRVQVFEQPDPSIKSELLTFEHVLSYLDKIEIPHGVSTKKSRKFFAYRLCFLNKILDFLKSSDEQREYRLDSVLSCKYRSYLKIITTSMNLRDRIVAATVIEIDILTEIKANLGEYYLDVKFSSGNQKFLIQKEFLKKRFSNTSVTQIADDKSSLANNNSSVTNNSSVVNDNSSVVNDNSSVTNNSSVVNDNSSLANDNSSVANDNSSVANDNSSVANDNSSIVNNNSSVVNDNSSIVNDNSSVANDNSSVANNNSSVANDSSSVANNNCSIMNDNSSVANDNSNSIDTDDDTTVINDDVQAVIVSTSDISVYDTLQST